MAITQAQFEKGILMSTGVAILHDSGFSYTTSATANAFTLFKPAAGFTNSHTASSLLTVNAAAGTVTCNFAGKIEIDLSGSFTAGSASSQDVTMHVFKNGVFVSDCFQRTINSIAYGSFAGGSLAITVADGDVFDLRIATTGTSRTLTFDNFKCEIEIVDI